MKITRMKINGMENPVGFNYDPPVISWVVEEARGQKQAAVRIEVSDQADFSHILYEKRGVQLSCTGTKLDMKLSARVVYSVRIRVTDESGDTAVGVTTFETGKLFEPWIAKWVGPSETDKFHPEIVGRFKTEKKAKSARLHICGVGMYEAYLNGETVGNEVLTPFLNDYRTALQAETYDVTNMIAAENKLCICLGNGWYKGRFGLKGESGNYGSRFAAIAEIHIVYEDEKVEIIASDETWTYCGSDIEQSGIYDGETLNRTLWDGKDNAEKQVDIVSIDMDRLKDRFSMPLCIKERLAVSEVIKTGAGETVLDMGQNFAGWIAVKTKLPRGTRIHLEFGEVLQNGNFFNENYGTATAGFVYVSNGVPEVARPHFTYFGFRYVRVTGWPGEINKDDFQGLVIYSDLERTGFFETNHDKINRLYANCIWGQKSNFLDMPTDCPQRSERLGWTGDAQVFCPAASYNMDTRAFYGKFLRDLRSEQSFLNGAVPEYIPAMGTGGNGCAVWGDAAALIPETLMRFYDNMEELEKAYPLMRDWVDWIGRQVEKVHGTPGSLWDFGFQFGDWLALDGITQQSFKGSTDDGYIASAYYCRSTEIVSHTAQLIGRAEDFEYYKKLARRIRESLLNEYFTPSGRLSVNTQAAFIIALKFGVYIDKEVLIKQFRDRLRNDLYQIKCGFVGAPLMCTVLCENGMTDLAYELLFREDFPSWLYAVNLGATTIWERWNSLLEDGTISSTGMNSLNHYSYGSVAEFMYAYIAGIRPQDNGFSKAILAPEPNMRLRYVKCRYASTAGTYVSEWNICEDGTLRLHFEIPFNCNATITMPQSGKAPFTVGAGSYDYEYFPISDYRSVYTGSTRLGQLMGDEEAMAVVYENIPQLRSFLASGDRGNQTVTLNDLKNMFFLGIQVESVDRTLECLEKLKRQGTSE